MKTREKLALSRVLWRVGEIYELTDVLSLLPEFQHNNNVIEAAEKIKGALELLKAIE